MDYESLSKKPNPFDGLDVEARRRLVVYLCHVAKPALTPENVRRRWKDALSDDDWPLAHEVIELADGIKEELERKKNREHPSSGCGWCLFVALLLFLGGIWIWQQYQEAETKRQQEEAEQLLRMEEAKRQQEEEQRLKVEETKRQQEEAEQLLRMEEAKRQQEEEQRLKVEEAKRQQEEERRRREEEAKRQREEEQRRREEEAKRQQEEAERLLRMEEAKRQQEEEQQRREEYLLQKKVAAESVRREVGRQSEFAKAAGAKEYAVKEWNAAIEKWRTGNDEFAQGDYEAAGASYRRAVQLLAEAANEATEKRRKAELQGKLSALQNNAAALVGKYDKWWKWSVDDGALLKMGNDIYKALLECNELPDFTASNLLELKQLMIRCYELAANGDALFQLYRLYGGVEGDAQNAGLVIKRDKDMALAYLRRAAAKGHPEAKIICGALETPPPPPPPAKTHYTSGSTSRKIPFDTKCPKCRGTGFKLKKKGNRYVPDIGSDTECPACRGTGQRYIIWQ